MDLTDETGEQGANPLPIDLETQMLFYISELIVAYLKAKGREFLTSEEATKIGREAIRAVKPGSVA